MMAVKKSMILLQKLRLPVRNSLQEFDKSIKWLPNSTRWLNKMLPWSKNQPLPAIRCRQAQNSSNKSAPECLNLVLMLRSIKPVRPSRSITQHIFLRWLKPIPAYVKLSKLPLQHLHAVENCLQAWRHMMMTGGFLQIQAAILGWFWKRFSSWWIRRSLKMTSAVYCLKLPDLDLGTIAGYKLSANNMQTGEILRLMPRRLNIMDGCFTIIARCEPSEPHWMEESFFGTLCGSSNFRTDSVIKIAPNQRMIHRLIKWC